MMTTNTTYYRADSVRKENAGSNEFAPIGKFCPRVEETEINAMKSDAGWYCQVAFGSSVTGYDSESEALEAGHQYMIRNGWTQNRDEAITQAISLATKRG